MSEFRNLSISSSNGCRSRSGSVSSAQQDHEMKSASVAVVARSFDRISQPQEQQVDEGGPSETIALFCSNPQQKQGVASIHERSSVVGSPTTSTPPTPNAPSGQLFRDLVINLAGSVHIPNLLQGSTTGMRSSFIPIFAKELGADEGMIGVITAAAGIARMMANFPAGQLTTKHGFTAVMNLGMAAVAIGSVVAAVAWSPAVLAFANFILGAGVGSFVLSRHVMLATIVEKKQRGRLMSMIGGGERWSSVIGPVVGGLLIEVGGNRLCAVAMVPAALACALCVSRSGRVRFIDQKFRTENRIRSEIEQETGEVPQGRDIITLLRHYGRLILSVGMYAMNIIQLRACRKLMLPLAAMNAGLRPSMVGLILSVSFAIDATLFFLGGMIMDKFGRKFSAIPTSINLGLAFFVLGQSQSTLSLFFAAIAFGFADSLGAGLLMTLNADHAPKKAGPEFMGVLRTVQDSGQLFGPLIAGWVAQAATFETACNLFGVLGLLNAVWALVMLPNEASDEDAAGSVESTHSPPTALTSDTAALVRNTSAGVNA
jgi:MFS family permease